MASTFDDIKKAGFKGVRLPVTYTYHYTTGAPDWKLDATWLQRVSDVLDQITSRGLYVITNVHHDSWTWADYTQANADVATIEDRLYKTWVQIGQKLACKGEKVVSQCGLRLEPMFLTICRHSRLSTKSPERRRRMEKKSTG